MEARTAGVLEMHATDAAARGIATGDEVEVFNARGTHEAARAGEWRHGGGRAWWRRGWSGTSCSRDGANVNALTSEPLTDIGGGATFYSTLVEVRKSQADVR